jgi:predicted membrane protein
MVFLRWLGGIVVFFWILGLLFRIGGSMIHWLLLIAAVVWLFSWITGRKRD